jgi:glycosyltransferase involved in cell wall biosynthesis
VLALTDNCGQNRAVLAGIGEASGRVVTVLDADLQDDPQVILRLLRMIDEGASVAFAGRRGAYESAARLKQSWMFKRLLWLLSRGRLPADAGLFLAMRSEVWTSLERTRGTFLLSRLARCGSVMRSWPVERQANPLGQTGYSNLRRLRLAIGVLWEAAAPAFLIRTPDPPRIAARLGARFRMVSNETETVANRDP